MVSIAALWLPILISAVLVFIASSLVHMVLGYHRADYGKVPDEDKVMDALRGFSIPPDDYLVPCPGKEGPYAKDFVEKRKKGPVLMMTVFPSGEMGMGKQLTMWFIFCIVVGVFVAYVDTLALTPGAPYRAVFHLSSVVAFVCYGMALWEISIWYRRKWGTTLRSNIDALIYALLTAGTFGWLWPR